jgi:hypothetical protein
MNTREKNRIKNAGKRRIALLWQTTTERGGRANYNHPKQYIERKRGLLKRLKKAKIRKNTQSP